MRHFAWIVAGLALAGCGDTDVASRSGSVEQGQEIEDSGVELDVEPVELDTLAWVRQGGTVTFDGHTWVIAGAPVFDPAVEYVGEYQGTPLYGEAGTAAHSRLFVPLEDDYWQMLERGTPASADTARTGLPVDTATVQVPDTAGV